jgi:hypothetical protein
MELWRWILVVGLTFLFGGMGVAIAWGLWEDRHK